MATTILLTGFGPFPGAASNPTEPLVAELAACRGPKLANVRRLAHVFCVSYETVDRELPELLAREKPDALLMFGLAARSRYLRVETLARNMLNCVLPDASGCVPAAAVISSDAPAELPLPAPAHRLVTAAKGAGVPVARSHNAGGYLCNYLCWRAAEAAKTGTPRLAAFIHVPPVPSTGAAPSPRTPLTFDDLLRAGEAILQTTLAATRMTR